MCLQCVPRRTAGPAKACASMGKLTILSSELSYSITFLTDFGQIAICLSELRFAFLKALGELWGAPGWLLAARETPGRSEGELREILNLIQNVNHKAKLCLSNYQNPHDDFKF